MHDPRRMNHPSLLIPWLFSTIKAYVYQVKYIHIYTRYWQHFQIFMIHRGWIIQLYWFPDFSPALKLLFNKKDIFRSTKCIVTKFCTNIQDPQRMNHTILVYQVQYHVMYKMFWCLDSYWWLPWNLVQIFLISRRWIIQLYWFSDSSSASKLLFIKLLYCHIQEVLPTFRVPRWLILLTLGSC